MNGSPTAAIVGCGAISVLHLEALQQLDIPIVAVCDTDQAKAEQTAAAVGAQAFTDHRELLAQIRPSVVHVCTPHDQHLPVALDALDGGAHLLVEKPLAATVTQAKELTAAAEQAGARGIHTGLVLQNRYTRPNQRLKEIISSGGLGEVQGATATLAWYRSAEYYRQAPWRGTWAEAGGGVLMNQAIHTLDLLMWFLGAAVAVSGHAATHRLAETIEVEDTAHMLLDHASGATSVLTATNCYPLNAPVTVTVHGKDGTAVMAGDLRVTWNDGATETVPAAAPGAVGRSYWGDSHRDLVADFYQNLDRDSPFWIGPQTGLGLVETIHAVYDSSANLRR